MSISVLLWDFGDTLVDERWMRRAPSGCATPRFFGGGPPISSCPSLFVRYDDLGDVRQTPGRVTQTVPDHFGRSALVVCSEGVAQRGKSSLVEAGMVLGTGPGPPLESGVEVRAAFGDGFEQLLGVPFRPITSSRASISGSRASRRFQVAPKAPPGRRTRMTSSKAGPRTSAAIGTRPNRQNWRQGRASLRPPPVPPGPTVCC